MRYVRNLEFEQKPDYKWLKSLFEDTATELGLDLTDHRFEWIEVKEDIISKKLAQE